MKNVLFVLTVLGCFFTSNVLAKEKTSDDYFSLDLADLMNIQVFVASKKSETISDAPSVVSVINAQDIALYGANDLLDVLGRVASIQTLGSNFFPDNIVSIRGQTLTHNANHILILINGRPYRDSISGGLNFSLYKSFPIEIIERIEIIRGPGSVLYGSGAFAGVIDIITKQADQHPKTSITLDYGSFRSRGIEGMGSVNGKNWRMMSGFKSSDTHGWEFSATDERGLTDSFDRKDKNLGLVFFGEYHKLSLDAVYTNTRQDEIGLVSAFPEDWVRIEKLFVDLGYEHKLGETWNTQYNITYNEMLEFLAGESNGFSSISNDYRFELNLSGPIITESVLLTLGGVYEDHRGRLLNAPGIPVETQWWNAYGQLEYQALEQLKLVAGIQWNKPEQSSSDFSPRLSALYKLTEHWGLKLLYGQAYRSPYASERKLDIGVLIGNTDLVPELIETSEAQLYYASKNHSSSLTVYHSQMKEIITRVPISPGVQQFTNAGEIEFDGVEFETKIRFSVRWGLDANFTWQENKDHADKKDTTFTPNIMAKVGINYDSGTVYQFGLYNNYFGNPTQISEINPSVSNVNPKPTDYHLLTANITIDINKMLNIHSSSTFEISLFADNLLDEDIHFPEFNRKSINSLPIHSGRAFYAQLLLRLF